MWIADKENGAFSKNKSWYIMALAETAVHALVLPDGTQGSSVTYRRYIREDYRGGVLEKLQDEFGKDYVVYSGKPNVYRYTPKEEQAN